MQSFEATAKPSQPQIIAPQKDVSVGDTAQQEAPTDIAPSVSPTQHTDTKEEVIPRDTTKQEDPAVIDSSLPPTQHTHANEVTETAIELLLSDTSALQGCSREQAQRIVDEIAAALPAGPGGDTAAFTDGLHKFAYGLDVSLVLVSSVNVLYWSKYMSWMYIRPPPTPPSLHASRIMPRTLTLGRCAELLLITGEFCSFNYYLFSSSRHS